MVCTKLFYIFGGLLGLCSGTGLFASLIYYYHKYEDLDCDDLRVGITIGIIALLGLVLNILLYFITCCTSKFRKFIIILFSLNVIGSLIYNTYLNIGMTDECELHYKEKGVWEYYRYFMAILFINTILIIGVFVSKCYIGD